MKIEHKQHTVASHELNYTKITMKRVHHFGFKTQVIVADAMDSFVGFLAI